MAKRALLPTGEVPEEQLFKVTIVFMGGRKTIREALAASRSQAVAIVRSELDEMELTFVNDIICE